MEIATVSQDILLFPRALGDGIEVNTLDPAEF